jgi:hypothetical protein
MMIDTHGGMCGDNMPASLEDLQELADNVTVGAMDALDEEEHLLSDMETLEDHHLIHLDNQGGEV